MAIPYSPSRFPIQIPIRFMLQLLLLSILLPFSSLQMEALIGQILQALFLTGTRSIFLLILVIHQLFISHSLALELHIFSALQTVEIPGMTSDKVYPMCQLQQFVSIPLIHPPFTLEMILEFITLLIMEIHGMTSTAVLMVRHLLWILPSVLLIINL